jgi:hypothetical protein
MSEVRGQGEYVRRDGRRGERRAEALLEICRVPQDLGCKLRGNTDTCARDYQSVARPDGESAEGSTYLFCRAVLKEIERARCGDDSSIAERRGVDKGPRVVE